MSFWSWLGGRNTYPTKNLIQEPIFNVPDCEYIEVDVHVEKLDILGSTESLGNKLKLTISNRFEIPASSVPQIKKDAQLLQTVCHELFHCGLWFTSYTHSDDKSSILYYTVDGSILDPKTVWDLKMIQEIGLSIKNLKLNIKFDVKQYPKIWSAVYTAGLRWNKWVGRNDFIKIKVIT